MSAAEVVDTSKRDVVNGVRNGSIRSERREAVNCVVVGDAVEVDGKGGEAEHVTILGFGAEGDLKPQMIT
jgi:hypothetical protein